MVNFRGSTKPIFLNGHTSNEFPSQTLIFSFRFKLSLPKALPIPVLWNYMENAFNCVFLLLWRLSYSVCTAGGLYSGAAGRGKRSALLNPQDQCFFPPQSSSTGSGRVSRIYSIQPKCFKPMSIGWNFKTLFKLREISEDVCGGGGVFT